jgi:glycosyltransferase involved in cell wall biosynthesis/phospholipid N-methyltransferase
MDTGRTASTPPSPQGRATAAQAAASEGTERTSLSVLVPVYNEQFLVAELLRRLVVLETSPRLERIEVIVVDDCSTDDTPRVLDQFRATCGGLSRASDLPETPRITWKFFRHEKNGGKGTALRTALSHATCELSVVQDADLEYHPKDLLRIVEVFVTEKADAVFGSRFAGGEARRVLMYRHELGNRLLTTLCNLVTNLNLTDMETCYKAVRTRLLKSMPLVSNDFRIEPELTIKLAKRRARIFEVPISYSGRTYQEGKKIGWRDGVKALRAIGEFAVRDDIYVEDAFGSAMLARLSRAPTFNQWMADVIKPHCGQKVLEIGSGVGNLTAELIPRREYVATDINPLYLDSLEALRIGKPYLRTQHTDVTRPETFPLAEGGFDTVICLNVIEHIEDDRAALRNIRDALGPGGTAIILVPQGAWNYGSLDEVLGHCRRYSKESLHALAGDAGFEVKELIEFNRMGTPAWFLNGKVLSRKHFGLAQVFALNSITPLVREIDHHLPFPSLSLIGVLRRT